MLKVLSSWTMAGKTTLFFPSLIHEWKLKPNSEEVEFIPTLKHATGLHCVCPCCSFGFTDKLSKAINTDMHHECGHSVWLGKSTGMCSWWAVKIAPCDAVAFCMHQQILQHILPLSSQLYFSTNIIKGQNRYLHLWNYFAKTYYYFYRKCPQKGGLDIFSMWLYPRHSWFNVLT